MASELGDVGVAVDDGVAAGEGGREPLGAPASRAGDVHQPDPRPSHLDDPPLGQLGPDARVVHVPLHGGDGRPERPQVGEEVGSGQVAGVEDQVGAAQARGARAGQPAGSARHVRVGDDRDLHGRRAPLPGPSTRYFVLCFGFGLGFGLPFEGLPFAGAEALPTVNGFDVSVVVRFGFVAALSTIVNW